MDLNNQIIEAAQEGNVENIYNLLSDDRHILEGFDSMPFVDTPLHISVEEGRVFFSLEIANLKPSFARKLNKNGLSPIHTASSKGNLEIVRGLLSIDSSLCRVKGKGMMTPLHFATIERKIDVMGELISTCSQTMEDLTVEHKTALHLSVENEDFGSFEFLLVKLQQLQKEELVNWEDNDGNTVLHLATSRLQLQMVKFLLEDFSGRKKVNLNVKNKNGNTALQELLLLQSNEVSRDIENILSHHEATSIFSEMKKSFAKKRDFFKYRKGIDPPGEVRNAILVVVTLIATATFQVGINFPGGVWQDDFNPDYSTLNSTTLASQKPHVAGTSILATRSLLIFYLILVYNTLAFLLSIVLFFYLTKQFPARFGLILALYGMLLTYSTSLSSIAPPGRLSTLLCAAYQRTDRDDAIASQGRYIYFQP
uniref:PGG domain-containing protein n=1 Tax=Nelumbo nucifera TaxID=4432 RepID=A0A822YE78_NELNU|nr:TPA_asm: hypothetical protein HUJ06_031017 [Nelumbo nucifera]